VDPIFRWNGEHFGFIHRWRLFDSRSYYLGWVDEGEVWRRDGTFLGELVDGCYVLRRRNAAPRAVFKEDGPTGCDAQGAKPFVLTEC
jgi:hypothetical protein